MTQVHPAPPSNATFQVIPAAEAPIFLKERSNADCQAMKAESILTRAERRADEIIKFATLQADQMTRSAQSAVTAMEQRIEAEATETATRTAELLESRQQAIEALSAMAQVKAIAADYAHLETWITDTILSAVRGIVADISPKERCIGQIRAALAKAKTRWNLLLTCHPDDYALTLAAVAEGQLEEAINKVLCDPSIAAGTVYLKSASEHIELNLSAQLDALHNEILRSLENTAEGTGHAV